MKLSGLMSSIPEDMHGTYKKVTESVKKYDPDQIAKDSEILAAAVYALEADLNLMENRFRTEIAKARAALKTCQSNKPKLDKHLTDMKTLGKNLEKYAGDAVKAVKAADTKKISAITSKSAKDGATFLKTTKSVLDTAKTLSKSYEEARAATEQTQKAAAQLRASQVKVVILSP